MSSDKRLSRGSAYEHHKKTTRAFRDCLAKLIPSNMRLVSVSDLATAVEHVLELSKKTMKKDMAFVKKRLKIHQSLLDNLEETIVMRELVGATYGDDMDDGHRHMIQVLKYCRIVLEASRAAYVQGKSTGERVKENVHDSHNKGGRYQVLGGHDDSDEEYEDSNGQVFKSDVEHDNSEDPHSLERPVRPPGSKDYSIENDLVTGSLAFQANFFFLTVENLFTIVADSYEKLKEKMDTLIKAVRTGVQGSKSQDCCSSHAGNSGCQSCIGKRPIP